MDGLFAHFERSPTQHRQVRRAGQGNPRRDGGEHDPIYMPGPSVYELSFQLTMEDERQRQISEEIKESRAVLAAVCLPNRAFLPEFGVLPFSDILYGSSGPPDSPSWPSVHRQLPSGIFDVSSSGSGNFERTHGSSSV